jgi:hypothetical protein
VILKELLSYYKMNYTEIDLSETSSHEEVTTNPLEKLKSNNSDIIDKNVIEKLITENVRD